MSMPSYPKHGADMTREQALTMVVASIAQEESALSHILNAEGEKLQAVIKRLEKDADLRCLLEANKSVTKLLDVVMQNQLLLRNKLALALECGGCCPPDCPCPPDRPPCPPEHPPCPPTPPGPCPKPPRPRSAAQLTGPDCGGFLWRGGCQLPWSRCLRQGHAVRWREDAPALVELDPDRAYSLHCQINLQDFLPTEASGKICLETGDAFPQQPPLFFAFRCEGGEPATLQYDALLLPTGKKRAEVSLRLCTRGTLCVSQAAMNLVEL